VLNSRHVGYYLAKGTIHPRACKAKRRRDGEPCCKWAVPGRNYCKFHGGHVGGKGPRVNRLPVFYAKRLSGTLKQVIETSLDAPVSEQCSVLEELAVMRETAMQVMLLFDVALTSGKEKLILNASMLVRDALKEIVATAKVAQDIENAASDKLSVHALGHVVNQIVKLAYEAFKDDLPKARVFEKLIHEKLVMPVEQVGTNLTPDQDALDMDSTVPSQ